MAPKYPFTLPSNTSTSPVSRLAPKFPLNDNKSFVTTNTDTKLVVRAFGGPSLGIPGTNYTVNYTCIKYTVKVDKMTWTTRPLKADVNAPKSTLCPDAVPYDDHDFGPYMLNRGPGDVTISIQATPIYADSWVNGFFRCSLTAPMPGSQDYICPLYPSYSASGTVQVAIDGMDMFDTQP
jgi:hypothetical protein